jgi:hypothetical protein
MISYKTYKNYSGPRVIGKKKYRFDNNSDHLERAFYLTSVVESGAKFGTVVMYDGTGVTAGLTQAIAVYPAALSRDDRNPLNDQGPLWHLLRMIEVDAGDSIQELLDEFKECNWYLAQDGKLRYTHSGRGVLGEDIRNEFTPMNGQVPRRGMYWNQSKKWCLLFNRLFSKEKTFDAQIEFGKSHILSTSKRKTRMMEGKTPEDLLYQGNIENCRKMEANELDLAACVFWSRIVNAPAIALRILYKASKMSRSSSELARNLLYYLGTSPYGRWSCLLSGGRYQRERKFAMKMKVWPRRFFESEDAIMPKKFYRGQTFL